MNDFHKEMAPVSGDVVRAINDLATPKWAIPFLGRQLNSVCKAKFEDADTKGFRLELPWEGQVKHESHNAYDDSTYTHELIVDVYSEGPAAGRIKSVQSHHWEYWHTTSNWQDHGESHTYDRREPNEDEIKRYKELLEGWTEGGSYDQIRALSDALAKIVREQNGKIRVKFDERKESGRSSFNAISISVSCEEKQSVTIDINIDHLIEALDYSRVYIEALHSKEDRQQIGICDGESWTLQYCLNFFNVFKDEELYPNIELSLKAWLYKIYCSCAYYREFMNIPRDVWWRDAWWRLQEVVEGERRVSDNKELLSLNCTSGGYHAKPLLTDDPFGSLVGRLVVNQNCTIKPYAIDIPYWVYQNIKGQKVRCTFKTVVANGIRWSICPRYSDEVVIDLASSEECEELKDGVAVIPYSIDGRVVTGVLKLSECVAKNWRKVVFAAPIKGDLDSKPVTLTSQTSEDWWDEEECDEDEIFPKLEKRLIVGEGAFKGWQMLEEVVSERKTCELGSYAFSGCPNLKKVDFGNHSCWIGVRCFQGCSSLVEVGQINGVAAEAFKDCLALKTISISSCAGLLSGVSAFEGCTSIEIVRIKKSAEGDKNVYCLPYGIFRNCSAIKEIFLPECIRILEDECLDGCSKDCVLHYEGDVFWFVGKGALPDLSQIYYWGQTIRYENKEVVLSTLLDQLGVKREQYVDACIKYQDADYSIATLIGIIMGKKPPSRRNYVDYYDDCDDYSPRTFEDAYEIYGSRLWDA